MTAKEINDGIKIGVFVDLGICTNCKHLMAEEVDYDYFMSEDGKCVAIPEGHEAPTFICDRKAHDGKLLTAIGLSYHSEVGEEVEETFCDHFEEDSE